jgi:hypothetical protein
VSFNPDLLDDLGAIVLDTNAMGDGSLNMSTLRELSKITAKLSGLEIWIPEPVMWEWASHAQQQFVEASNTARRLHRKLSQAGIDSGVKIPSDDESSKILDRVIASLESLPSPFRILRLVDHPEVAAEALKDQILQAPPAKLKSDVKTGAADSASLRLSQAEADSNGLVYAVVSGDGDVRKALEHWGIDDVAVFPNLKILREALLAFQPLELRLIKPLLQQVDKMFKNVRIGVVSLGKVDSDQDGLIEHALGSGVDFLSTDVDVEQISKILLVRSVEVDQESSYGTAEVIASANIRVTGWRMDDRGDELISDSETVYDTVLTIPVTFTVSETIEDLHIESVTASPNRDGYDTAAEALNELVYITEEVPGLRELIDDEGMPPLVGGRQWKAEVNGKHVTLTLESPLPKDRDRPWSLEIDVSGQKAVTFCVTRDASSSRTDGFHYGRPVSLVSDDEPAEFSLARFALRTIYGPWDEMADDGPVDMHG